MDIVISPDVDWRLYTPYLPSGADVVGTAVKNGRHGVLVRYRDTGRYVRLAGGVITSVDHRHVNAALKLSGRPKTMDGGRYVNVYLDADTIETARRVGGGNLSRGVRDAVAAAKNGLTDRDSCGKNDG